MRKKSNYRGFIYEKIHLSGIAQPNVQVKPKKGTWNKRMLIDET